MKIHILTCHKWLIIFNEYRHNLERGSARGFTYKTYEKIIIALILSKENNYHITKKTHRLTRNSCTKVFIIT